MHYAERLISVISDSFFLCPLSRDIFCFMHLSLLASLPMDADDAAEVIVTIKAQCNKAYGMSWSLSRF